MALNSLGLGLLFTAKDATKGVIKKIGDDFVGLEGKASTAAAGFKKAVAGFGVGLAVFTAGAVGVAAAFKAAGVAGPFEQGLAGVGAVSRATADELAMLRESAIEAGIATQFSPDQAVEGLTSLATAGQTAEQATATLIPVLDLAAGSLGQLGVAGAAEAVVGTLKSYGKEAGEAAGVTDKLLRITQLSNFQTRDFATGLAKAAASGSEFNQGIDDVLITMGLLRDRNIDASSAATAFREATRRLGVDAKAQSAITEKGVTIFDKQTGKMRSLIDITQDFVKATENLSEKERLARIGKAFGARGLLAFGAIMKAQFTKTMPDGTKQTLKGAAAIEELRKQMGDAGGTAAEFREKLLDTFEGQKTLLTGSAQTLGIVFGEPFAKALKPVVSVIVAALNILIQIVKAIPGPIKTLLATIFIAASAGIALFGAILAIQAAIVIVKAALVIFGAALLPVLIIAGKIILVIAALVAIGFVLKKAWEANFGGIRDFVTKAFSRIKLVFSGLKQLIRDGGFSGDVLKEMNKADGGIKNFVISAFALIHRLQMFFEGFFGAIESSVGPVIAEVGAAFGELFSAIEELLVQFGFADVKLVGSGEGFKTFGAVLGSVMSVGVQILLTFVRAFLFVQTTIIKGITLIVQFMNFLRQGVDVVFAGIGDKLDAIGGGVMSIVGRLAGAASSLGFDVGAIGGPTPALATAGGGGGVVPAAAAAGGSRPGIAAISATTNTGGTAPSAEEIAAILQSQPIMLTNVMTLDGQQIAENQQNVTRREAATTFGSVKQEG